MPGFIGRPNSDWVVLRANEAWYRAGAINLFELEDARRQFKSTKESSIAAARDRASLGANLTAGRLRRDAADSPIVADENQNSFALSFMYRF